MKNLQKVKDVKVKVFYVSNGHYVDKLARVFDCELKAKRYVEALANEREYLFIVSDNYNELYRGNEKKYC